jgi:hypothetical protein
MTDSRFLRMARARDDEEFVQRIAAAMTLKALYQADFELIPESRAMTDWVLEHPMEALPRMVSFVSTNGSVVNSITIIDNAIDTSAVPDSDIEYVVGEKWDVVAKLQFPVQVQ